MCYDLESESITNESTIERSSKGQTLIESGEECLYFVAGAKLGKIEVPSMKEEFLIDTEHSDEIIGMTVSSDNQIITT